jgi:hypothetical protein
VVISVPIMSGDVVISVPIMRGDVVTNERGMKGWVEDINLVRLQVYQCIDCWSIMPNTAGIKTICFAIYPDGRPSGYRWLYESWTLLE